MRLNFATLPLKHFNCLDILILGRVSDISEQLTSLQSGVPESSNSERGSDVELVVLEDALEVTRAQPGALGHSMTLLEDFEIIVLRYNPDIVLLK